MVYSFNVYVFCQPNDGKDLRREYLPLSATVDIAVFSLSCLCHTIITIHYIYMYIKTYPTEVAPISFFLYKDVHEHHC